MRLTVFQPERAWRHSADKTWRKPEVLKVCSPHGRKSGSVQGVGIWQIQDVLTATSLTFSDINLPKHLQTSMPEQALQGALICKNRCSLF